MQHADKITGVDSYNERTGVKPESGSTGATDKADKMALIEEAIEEVERDIMKWTDKLEVTETETEHTWDNNAIYPDLGVQTL